MTTVKVGKLLGASLIVTGAYQRGGSSVRLTARFVKVETGEVVGTAKVDGATSDFLSCRTHHRRAARPRGSSEAGAEFIKRTRPK